MLNVDEMRELVKNARVMMNTLYEMDDTKQHRELRNSLNGHWSLTYVPKNKTYHLYLEDSRFCFVVKFANYHNGEKYDYLGQNGVALSFKRATTPYKEGTSSIVLLYTDYANGPLFGPHRSEWNLDEYKRFGQQIGGAPYFTL